MALHDWHCAFCGLRTEPSADRIQQEIITPTADSAQGPSMFRMLFVCCPNLECRALTSTVSMHVMIEDAAGVRRVAPEPVRSWRLVPASVARPLPDYIPPRIVAEYTEACAVLEVSPAASATLARRCLQAIIRDFFGVKKNTLADEMEAVKEKLEPEIWALIEITRKHGNIGKNMEKGVNLVLDVEPGEPQRLIALIEYFIDECYIARHARKQRLDSMRSSLAPGR